MRHSARSSSAVTASTGPPQTDAYKNMIVAIRIRPENEQERTSGKSRIVITPVGENMLVFDPADSSTPQRSKPLARPKGHRHRGALNQPFAFDRVFDEHATQEEVYRDTVACKHIIETVLSGINACVFAYGATGSGKTYTMLGTSVNNGSGIMVRTMRDLFHAMHENSHEKIYETTISYIEIYNETIRDLLVAEGTDSSPLDLREDTQRGICSIAGVTEVHPTTPEEVFALLERGNKIRRQSPTDANAQSSRSHAVLQISVRQRDRASGLSEVVRFSKLSMIDLAGSERASVSKNRGDRMREGANINRSLLALGKVINALVKGDKHVPYRESKLTRLLKDSLGGNCRTVMIANVSPSSLWYEDTHNTLKYANFAKEIKPDARANIVRTELAVSRYQSQIDNLSKENSRLKSELARLRAGGAPGLDAAPTGFEELKKALETHFEERLNQLQKIHDIEQQNFKLNADIENKNAVLLTSEIPPDDERRMREEVAMLAQQVKQNSKAKIQLQEAHDALAREYSQHFKHCVEQQPHPLFRLVLLQLIEIYSLKLSKLELAGDSQRRIQKLQQQLSRRYSPAKSPSRHRSPRQRQSPRVASPKLEVVDLENHANPANSVNLRPPNSAMKQRVNFLENEVSYPNVCHSPSVALNMAIPHSILKKGNPRKGRNQPPAAANGVVQTPLRTSRQRRSASLLSPENPTPRSRKFAGRNTPLRSSTGTVPMSPPSALRPLGLKRWRDGAAVPAVSASTSSLPAATAATTMAESTTRMRSSLFAPTVSSQSKAKPMLKNITNQSGVSAVGDGGGGGAGPTKTAGRPQPTDSKNAARSLVGKENMSDVVSTRPQTSRSVAK